jgi:putative endonuclease
MAWKRSSVRSRPGPPKYSAMSSVYVLQSESTGRFYIGCADDAPSRVAEHNRGQTISPRHRGPWKLVYQEDYSTLAEVRGSGSGSEELEISSLDSGIDRLSPAGLSASRPCREGRRYDPDPVHQIPQHEFESRVTSKTLSTTLSRTPLAYGWPAWSPHHSLKPWQMSKAALEGSSNRNRIQLRTTMNNVTLIRVVAGVLAVVVFVILVVRMKKVRR